jgi:cytoskeletal protein RodZ
MQSLGDRVRHERESRNKTLEEIAAATGIQQIYLEALEKNEFDALPGRAFGKLYIRAYAEALGFDPRALLDEYDREVRTGSSEPPPAPARERPVESEIARWRETVLAKRGRQQRAADEPRDPHPAPPSVEADPLVELPPTPIRAEDSRRESTDERREALAKLLDPKRQPPNRPWLRRGPLVATLIVFSIVGAAWAIYSFSSRTAVPDVAAPATPTREEQEPPRTDPPPAVPERTTGTEPAPKPVAVPPPKTNPVAPASPGSLTIPEFGVGRKIVQRRLEGEDDRFTEREVAWFSTRVLGGNRGTFIRHVWIHEGKVKQSIRLKLGGPDWRTYSSRTLRDLGQWAAEARDAEGRVLAQSTFTVVAPDR